MPNHISNVLTITGEKTDIKKLIQKVRGKKSDFSFESFFPMPEHIDPNESSAAPAWYDWRVANWGTKWDCYEVSSISMEGDSIILSFQTAWSTPVPAFIKLSTLFPDVTIVCEFADEDMGCNVGQYNIKNGEVINFNCLDYSEDSVKLAQRIYEKADQLLLS